LAAWATAPSILNARFLASAASEIGISNLLRTTGIL
jgi:hypothetical protein